MCVMAGDDALHANKRLGSFVEEKTAVIKVDVLFMQFTQRKRERETARKTERAKCVKRANERERMRERERQRERESESESERASERVCV